MIFGICLVVALFIGFWGCYFVVLGCCGLILFCVFAFGFTLTCLNSFVDL